MHGANGVVISLLQPINLLATVVTAPRGRVSRGKICNIVTCLVPFVNEKNMTGNSTKEKPCLANGKLIAVILFRPPAVEATTHAVTARPALLALTFHTNALMQHKESLYRRRALPPKPRDTLPCLSSTLS